MPIQKNRDEKNLNKKNNNVNRPRPRIQKKERELSKAKPRNVTSKKKQIILIIFSIASETVRLFKKPELNKTPSSVKALSLIIQMHNVLAVVERVFHCNKIKSVF